MQITSRHSSSRIIHTVDLLVEKGDNAEKARLGEGNVKDHSDHHQVLHVPKLHVSSRCKHAQCHKLFQQSSGQGAHRGFGCMGGNIGSLESFPKLRGVTITTTCRLGRRTNWPRPCRIVESIQQQGDLLRALRPKGDAMQVGDSCQLHHANMLAKAISTLQGCRNRQ